jgi:hypothetical protein
MQLPPLTFLDVSLLLALGALILLITLELTSPYHGITRLAVNRRKLRNVSILVAALFLITISIRLIGLLFNI